MNKLQQAFDELLETMRERLENLDQRIDHAKRLGESNRDSVTSAHQRITQLEKQRFGHTSIAPTGLKLKKWKEAFPEWHQCNHCHEVRHRTANYEACCDLAEVR